jgi:hypothetical protein
MARLYAQVFTLVFFVVGFGGLILGDAGSVKDGQGGGNLGSVTLHMTWVRHAIDIALFAVFAYVGFVASRRLGRILVTAAGVFLFALGVAGFIAGDDGFAGLHFPVVINAFDLVAGVLGILSGLGTIEDEAEPA